MSGKRRADAPASPRDPRRGRPRRPGKPTGKPQRSLLRRVVKWLLILGLVGAIVLAGLTVIVYRSVDLPTEGNAAFRTNTSFVYYDDGKEQVGTFATQNRETIPLTDMPQSIQDAVIAIENPTFWTDKGVDPKGILRAAFSNAQGNSTQGGSTITQQYVKILYLNQERSYTRKIKEAVMALKLQQQLSKKEILAGYLNTIYFGNGSYGVQAAAKSYFGVEAKQLTVQQSAALAAVLNNPSLYDPYEKDSKKRLRGRYQIVLEKMAEQGDITAEEATTSERRLPKFTPPKADSTYGGQKGHMLDLVKTELRQLNYSDAEIEGGGLKVTTTFDKAQMDNAAAAVAEIRPDISDDELHVAVASVEPGTGALRSFFGGQDYLKSQINWAATGGQPGSTFKAFAIAAALKEGFSLKDTFEGNSPFWYNEEETGDEDAAKVRNEGGGDGTDYGSAVSLLTASEESINTAFADLTMSIPDGPEKIMDLSEKMGIPAWDKSDTGLNHLDTSPGLEPVSGIALGSATIAPINMANAYATIANEGKAAKLHVIEKVVSPNGDHDYDFKDTEAATPVKAISADVAADTSYALQQVVQSGTGANAQAIGRPAAGKTGTATNALDQVSSSWFVGYTPQLSTAVMYVRGKGNEQLDDDWLPSYNGAAGYFGSNYPTRTWAALMEADLEGTEVEDFPEPANLDGDAPDDGHSPYVPPPPKPKPTKKPTKVPTDKPSDVPTQEPTQAPVPTQAPTTQAPPPVEPPPATPTPTPPAGCQIFDCSTPTPTPTPTPGTTTPRRRVPGP